MFDNNLRRNLTMYLSWLRAEAGKRVPIEFDACPIESNAMVSVCAQDHHPGDDANKKEWIRIKNFPMIKRSALIRNNWIWILMFAQCTGGVHALTECENVYQARQPNFMESYREWIEKLRRELNLYWHDGHQCAITNTTYKNKSDETQNEVDDDGYDDFDDDDGDDE